MASHLQVTERGRALASGLAAQDYGKLRVIIAQDAFGGEIVLYREGVPGRTNGDIKDAVQVMLFNQIYRGIGRPAIAGSQSEARLEHRQGPSQLVKSAQRCRQTVGQPGGRKVELGAVHHRISRPTLVSSQRRFRLSRHQRQAGNHHEQRTY